MAEDEQSQPNRGRGRPPAEEPGMPVTAWLRVSEHERLQRVAVSQGLSISQTIRKILILRLP